MKIPEINSLRDFQVYITLSITTTMFNVIDLLKLFFITVTVYLWQASPPNSPWLWTLITTKMIYTALRSTSQPIYVTHTLQSWALIPSGSLCASWLLPLSLELCFMWTCILVLSLCTLTHMILSWSEDLAALKLGCTTHVWLDDSMFSSYCFSQIYLSSCYQARLYCQTLTISRTFHE